MRAKADQEETTNVAIVVLPIDFSHVAVPVCSHQHVQLLPNRVHPPNSSSLLSLSRGFFRELRLSKSSETSGLVKSREFSLTPLLIPSKFRAFLGTFGILIRLCLVGTQENEEVN